MATVCNRPQLQPMEGNLDRKEVRPRFEAQGSHMSQEQNPSDHIPDEKLIELATPSAAETGSVALASILTREESIHFRQCDRCIDALAKMVRELIQKKSRQKKAG